jgi:hypothetical protein
MKKTYVFDGQITTISPISTCGPALSKQAGSDAKPIPKIRTASGDRMYFPGQAFRSKLRGGLTHLAGEMSLRKNGVRFSLSDAQYLRLGGVKQAGAEAALSPVELAQMLEKNPLIALFGASTPWVTGKLMVGHLIDTQVIEAGTYEPMLVDGVRADPIRRDPSLVQYLDDSALGEMAAASAKVREYGAAKREIADLEKTIRATRDLDEKKGLRVQLDTLKKASKEKSIVSTQMPLSGYQSIPPGSTLEQKIHLLGGSEIELGALLASLEQFSYQPLLGAHIAHGNGVIAATWTISVVGSKETGVVQLVPFGGLEIQGDFLMAAKTKFEETLANGGFEFALNAAAIAETEAVDE